MSVLQLIQEFVPQYVPEKMNGTLRIKIVQKKDAPRKDGTCPLYVRLFLGRRKRIPIGISIPIKFFDGKNQCVRNTHPSAKDYNLIIEKKRAAINDVAIRYRLSNQLLTMDKLLEELERPTHRIDYNVFAAAILESQKSFLKPGTYRQQKAVLNKIARFKSPLYFNEIDQHWLNTFKSYCKNKLGNKKTTINSTVKTFKKYLHQANDKGILTPLHFKDVSIGPMLGDRVFLLPSELKTIIAYYENPFITEEHRKILKRFLFSCFTGIRISDSEKINKNNFIGDYLAFTMVKTEKFLRILLNDMAKRFAPGDQGWEENYTREHINRQLKIIARICKIPKRLHFHASRHTFGTNFIIAGGRVENLQRLMGHSDIKQTMIYVHIVQSATDTQIKLMDKIVD